jgi:hypothetical protein
MCTEGRRRCRIMFPRIRLHSYAVLNVFCSRLWKYKADWRLSPVPALPGPLVCSHVYLDGQWALAETWKQALYVVALIDQRPWSQNSAPSRA